MGDLYGTHISVALVDYLRPEKKFDSLEALITQMYADCDQARRILSLIDLPSVGQADRQPDRFVQVLVDKEAALKVKDGQSNSSAISVELADLVAQVRQLQGPAEPGQGFAPVVISADKSVKYESVVQVMDKLQRAGIQRVGLSVQQQP